MTTDDRIDKIESKLNEHDKKIQDLEKKQLSDKFELSKLITEAVNKGVQPLLEKLEKQDKRITALEQAEAQKALKKNQEMWKTIRSVIISVIITFFATIIINNLISIANDNINGIDNNKIEEVKK